MIRPLSSLFLFHPVQTREQYEQATGMEPPPFDPTRPAQYWSDPDAANSPKRIVTYERVLAVDERGNARRGADGAPYLEELVLLKQEAATVNIPYKKGANEPSSGLPDIPVPLRAPEPGEELTFGFGGIVIVRDRLAPEASAPGGFTDADRELLRQIAIAVGAPAQ